MKILFFIESLLSEAGLLGETVAGYSTACINTSRPIYLVFGNSSDHPLYVIRKITGTQGLVSSRIDRKMYELIGNLVPEPLGFYELAGESYDVQKGVKGSPWFQLRSKVRSDKARAQIEKRMWQSLNDFQKAICPLGRNCEDSLQPRFELLEAFSGYQNVGGRITEDLLAVIENAVADLSHTPKCPAIPQHGDFCLNNLIIDTNHITVIDFEDFSITHMPMYDAFTLGLTLPSFGHNPENAANVIKQPAVIAAAQELGIPVAVLRWHFLHHLLLRLGPWSAGENRSRYRDWLNRALQNFINENTKNMSATLLS